MNTPAHILLGAAAFGRSPDRGVLVAAALGAIAPDASLYALAGTSLFVLQIPPQVVFDELYFSDAWQTMFAIDNSFFVWGSLLGFAIWWRSRILTAFAGAGLLHLIIDFPLHAGDGRPHFWPMTRWVFDSPVSYWDSSHHALWVAPVTLLISISAYGLLWQSGLRWLGRLCFGGLLAAEIWVAHKWIMFF